MAAPAALAWYGGVGTTAALSDLLLKFLNDFASVQENVESLRLKIKDDLDLIHQFMTFIKDLPTDEASGFDSSVLDELASYLQPLMIRCEIKIRTIREATSGKSNVEAYTSRLAIGTVEAIEKDLASWVQRLHTRVSLLSERLKLDATRTVGKHDSGLQFQYEMQSLSSEIRALRANGQTVDYGRLWLSESLSVDFRGAPRQRRMNGTLTGQEVLVEYITYNAVATTEAAQDAVGELAFILNRSDPSIFHILKCINIFQQQDATSRSATYGLVFQLPPGLVSIRPLSDSIGDENNSQIQVSTSTVSQMLPPDVRIARKIGSKNKIAFQLAVSLHYLHSFGYVHQSIRTSNILISLFENVHHVEAYLGGFERSRPNAATSNQRRIDADWRNNIYRSPHRVATTDEETIKRHTMSHDIYSLGVVLLELGLFKLLTSMESKFKNKTAEIVRTNLIQLANEDLPTIMGDTYVKVVLHCLGSTPDSWLAAHVAEISYAEEVVGPLERLSRYT